MKQSWQQSWTIFRVLKQRIKLIINKKPNKNYECVTTNILQNVEENSRTITKSLAKNQNKSNENSRILLEYQISSKMIIKMHPTRPIDNNYNNFTKHNICTENQYNTLSNIN